MIKFDSDCEWWVLVAVGSFMLFVLSEILPVLRPVQGADDGEDDVRVQGVVHFLTFMIRTRWVRHHPAIRDFLRFTRDVVAEENIPPSPETPVTPDEIVVELDEVPQSETVSSRTRSHRSDFKPVDEGKDREAT